MSDNPPGADNQQERLSIDWVVGFVDGEGCFFVGVNRQPSMRIGWQVLPEFRVVQHERDVALLEQLRQFFGCGQITTNHGDRKELRIRGLKELSERVGPFFKAHPLRTVKRSSFDCFAEVVTMMQQGDHLTMEGLEKIRRLANRMNRGAQNPQRPYAERPVSLTGR
jgi:LAGLIDADG DNA endonuclease family protein